MGLPVPPSQRMIHVKLRFVGFHMWPDAPEGLEYLKDRHRHEFHVEVNLGVTDHDRELEFFVVKDWLMTNPLKDLHFAGRLNDPADEKLRWSCERMAEYIGQALRVQYGDRYTAVGVFEDGENGGIVVWDR